VPGRWVIAEQTFDFREGGRGRKRFGPRDDPRFATDTVYREIVQDRRIVYSYALSARDVPVSVSLTTVALAPDGQGTRLLLVEQIVFLDGNDDAVHREEGLSSMLDKIGEWLLAA
jgi:uncharacterized protein YndB with AHSA1/START domain